MPRSSVSPPPVTLAKFSRPRLYDVLRRERLFERLDAARSHPIVWIAGPPGAGKSTLIASYLDARKVHALWFQADAADADPGTFFHYLTLAASEMLRGRAKRVEALPRYGPEYAADLATFTRRFLRAFFALFAARSIIVIDNFHEAPANAAWRHAFSEGLRELPAGLNLVFVSRMPPPPEMARLIADQSITRIDWSELRFTAGEATAMTATAGLAASVAQHIHRVSDGWAAGIVLMREHLAGAGELDAVARVPESKDAVFAYFTGEIFERARPTIAARCCSPRCCRPSPAATRRPSPATTTRHAFSTICIGNTCSPIGGAAAANPSTSFTRCSANSCSRKGASASPPMSAATRSIVRRGNSFRAASSTPQRRSTGKRRRGPRSPGLPCTPAPH